MNQLGLGVTFALNDQGTANMARAGQSMVAFDQTAARVAGNVNGSSDRLSAGMNRFGAAFMSGAQLLTAGGGMLAGFIATTDAAARFGVQVGQIHTIVDEAAFSTEQIAAVTDSLALAYGADPLQQAKGLYETLSAGITDTAKATDLLTVANKFAVGGNSDLVGGVDVLTSALNTYADVGLTAQEASDALFVAIAKGKTTAPELAHYLGEVAPTAHALGVSFDELTGAIGAVTASGIKTPQAMTGINAMLSNIASPSADAAKEAQRLGVGFDFMALKTKGLAGFLKDITGSTKLTDESLVKLFGSIDGKKVALTLAAKEGAAFTDVMNAMKEKTNATDRAVDKMTGTLQFSRNIFDAMFGPNGVVTRSIGEALEPFEIKLRKLGTELGSMFLEIPKPVRDLIVQATAGLAAMVALSGAVLVVGGSVGYLVTQIRALGLTTGMFGWMAAGVAAVSLAVMAYQANIGGFGDYVDRVAGRVRLAVEGLSQLINDGGFSGEVLGGLNQDTGLKDFVVQLYVVGNVISDFLGGAWAGIKEGIEAARPTFENMGLALTRLATTLGLVKEGVDPIKGALDLQSAGESGRSFGTTVAAALETVVKVITAVVNIVDGFVQQWDKLPDVTGPFAEGLSEVGSAITSVLTDLGLMNSAVGSTDSTFAMIGSGSAKALHAAISLIGTAFSVVGSIVKDVVNIISGAIKIVVNLLRGDFSGAWEGVKQVMLGATQAAADVILGLVEVVAEAIDALFGFAGRDVGMSARVKDIRDSLKNTSQYLYGAAPTENTGEISPERAAYMANKAAGGAAGASPGELTADTAAYYLAARDAGYGASLSSAGPTAAAAAYYASPAATDQAAVTQALVSQLASTAAPDVDGLNASISSLRAAKEGPVTLSGDLLIDGERAGRLLMSANQSAAAASGAPVGLVVE